MSLTKDDIVLGKKYKFNYNKNDKVLELEGKAVGFRGNNIIVKVVKKYNGYYGQKSKSTSSTELDYIVSPESLKEL